MGLKVASSGRFQGRALDPSDRRLMKASRPPKLLTSARDARRFGRTAAEIADRLSVSESWVRETPTDSATSGSSGDPGRAFDPARVAESLDLRSEGAANVRRRVPAPAIENAGRRL